MKVVVKILEQKKTICHKLTVVQLFVFCWLRHLWYTESDKMLEDRGGSWGRVDIRWYEEGLMVEEPNS